MLVLVFLVAAGGGAAGRDVEGVQVSCGAPARLPLASEPEPGRYRVRYCLPKSKLPAAPDHWEWDLTLKVLEQPQENCSFPRLKESVNGNTHSSSTHFFNKSVSCGPNFHMCVSQTIDLVFRGCYKVHHQVKIGKTALRSEYDIQFVDSNLTREHFLKYNTTDIHSFKSFDHDNNVSFLWETKIPLTDYDILLCINKTEDECSEVTAWCGARGPHVLWCAVRAPAGCHRLHLTHHAPWTAGDYFSDIRNVLADFCHGPPSLATVESGSWVTGAAVAGAASGAAALLAAACWRRRRRARRRHKERVLDAWQGSAAITAERVPASGDKPRGVLLLHARDCAALSRLARVLAALLRDQLHLQVWDVYSPEVVAATGASPSAWVRQALQDPAVPLVLLQTPALQLLAPAPPTHSIVPAPAPSVAHFVTPLSYCLLADLCNHTWVAECGRDYYVRSLPPRYFRDECDMLEYNCDRLRDYEPVNYTDCIITACPKCSTCAPVKTTPMPKAPGGGKGPGGKKIHGGRKAPGGGMGLDGGKDPSYEKAPGGGKGPGGGKDPSVEKDPGGGKGLDGGKDPSGETAPGGGKDPESGGGPSGGRGPEGAKFPGPGVDPDASTMRVYPSGPGNPAPKNKVIKIMRRTAARKPTKRTFKRRSPFIRTEVEAPAPLLGAGAGAGGARVVHRAPHCADALLPAAVAALAAAQAPAPAYRKYFIATVSALEVEAVRTVVPYRRYALPGAAPALLRDLRALAGPPDLPEVPDDALRDLRDAHRDLLQFVRNNPDFLAQEMMVI